MELWEDPGESQGKSCKAIFTQYWTVWSDRRHYQPPPAVLESSVARVESPLATFYSTCARLAVSVFVRVSLTKRSNAKTSEDWPLSRSSPRNLFGGGARAHFLNSGWKSNGFFVFLPFFVPRPSFSCLTSVQLLLGCIPCFSKFIIHKIALSQSVRYIIICFILICSNFIFPEY